MSCPDLHSGWVNFAYFSWDAGESAWKGYWSGVEGYPQLKEIPGSTFANSVSVSVTFVPLNGPSGATRLVISDGGSHEVVSHPGVGVAVTYERTVTYLNDGSRLHLYFGPETGGGHFLVKDVTVTPCPTVPEVTQPPAWAAESWYKGDTNDFRPITFISGCAEFSYVEYGSLLLTPISTWNYGYRPTEMIIDSPGFYGIVEVLDTNGGIIGSYTGPDTGGQYTIPLTFTDYDIRLVSIQIASESLSMCGTGITFNGGGGGGGAASPFIIWNPGVFF